ncbi:PAS domain S-box protein [Bacillus tianshenii]|nr:PAS domain S-box protein [Bacillus tianshenii]
MDRFKEVLNNVKKIYPLFDKKSSDLEETYEILSSLLTHSADAIAILSTDGIVKQVNPAFEELYGWELEELIDKRLPFTEEEYENEINDLIVRVRNGETIRSYETTRTNRNNEKVHVSITLSPIRSSEGEVVAISSFIRDNQQRIETERRLEESKSRYQSLFQYSPDAIFSLDLKGNILKTNSSCETLIGCMKEQLTDKPFLQLITPDDMDLVRTRFYEALEGQSSSYEARITRKDGVERQLLINNVPIFINEKVIGVYCIGQDRTEMNKALQALKESEERYRLIADHSQDLITVHRTDGRITYASPSHSHLLGYEPNQLLEQPLCNLVHPEEREKLNAFFYESIMTKQPFTCRVRKRTNNEEWIWYEVKGNPVSDEKHNLIHVILVSREITQQVQYEKELNSMAFFDELTGLPNRRLFYNSITKVFSSAQRHQYSFAVLYLDGDEFKKVNDTFGHDVGDDFLEEVAARLQAVIREEDTISRLGGDEFAVLLSRLSAPAEADEAAKRILAHLSKPFHIKGNKIDSSFSIGISAYPADGQDIESLMKHADEALYHAKDKGKNCYVHYKDIPEE